MENDILLRVAVWSPDFEVAVVADATFDDWEIVEVATLEDVAREEARGRLDYVLIDVDRMLALTPNANHRSCVKALHSASIGARIVIMTPTDRVRDAVDFVRMGADDYLTCPVTPEGLVHVRNSIVEQERTRAEVSYLRRCAWESEALGEIPCRSPAMAAALFKVRQVAPTNSTILLTGETGTGKSFFAGVVHHASKRADRQLVRVHCGAIPDSLLESELFGHEKGAFTGADRRKLGKFEIADGGTILLDEIGTISPAMQVKLLHVLQERRFQRVGGEHDIEVDVRVIAATNQDLKSLAGDGVFRRDLYYRLNVFPIEIPPLRQRREDVPALVETLFDRLCVEHGKDTLDLHPAVIEAFMRYDWPGNVRELENLLERAVILESGSRLLPEDFPDELFGSSLFQKISVDPGLSLAEIRDQAVERAEILYLREQLALHGGRIESTAQAAGISTRQLHRLMTRYGLDKDDFKNR